MVADAEPLFERGAVEVLSAAGIHALAGDPVRPGVPVDGMVLDTRLGSGPYARELVDRLVAAHAGLAVVLVADRPRSAGIAAAMEAGVRAIVHRRCSGEELVAATEAALRGQNWLSAPLAGLLRTELLAEASGESAGELTAREREVLRGLARGGSNAAIARTLGVSEHTVRNHVHSLTTKLGAANRTDAVVIAARRGLVELVD